VAAALVGVEVAMEEPEAVPVGADGGPPVTATAPAEPTPVDEVEVPVAQPVVATQAPAAVTVPPGAAVPLCGGKGRPAERVPGEGGTVTPDAKEPRGEEGEGASVTRLAPMRLNSNFSAAAA
jgi:hypothetical protein